MQTTLSSEEIEKKIQKAKKELVLIEGKMKSFETSKSQLQCKIKVLLKIKELNKLLHETYHNEWLAQ